MRVKFNTLPPTDTKTVWGYTVEVTPEGVFGDISDELAEIEVAAGRVTKVGQAKKVEVAVEDKPQAAADVVAEGSGKRVGRPPKAE
jgi:hypothetical protein